MHRVINLAQWLIGWPLTILAFFFLGKILLANSLVISQSLLHLNLFHILFALCFFIAFYAIRILVWQHILKHKGPEFSYKESAYLWSLSEFRRYIPGSVWSLLGRTVLFRQKGVGTAVLISSLLTEAQLLVVSSLIASAFFFSYVYFKMLGYSPLAQILTVSTFFALFIAVFVYCNTRTITSFWPRFVKNIFSYLFPSFAPKQTLLLLGLYALAFVCFGLGCFFASISIVFLPPSLLLEFIGFFCFALLVGYLSLVTPMGLGVREAVITTGLLFFVSVPQAGLVAILCRIVLIGSELLFFAAILVWKNAKGKIIQRVELFIASHKHEVILGLSVFSYILYFTALSFLRYDNYYTGRFDLGNMDQTVWNTSRGRVFQITDPNGTNTISRLAFHADFILILLAPLYKIWSDPKTLLVLQTIILSLGAVFIFLLAKRVLQNKTLSLILGVSYLINPFVGHSNLYDFHAVTLATTFLLGAFYFLVSKNYLWFFVFSILSGLTKEHVWIILALFGGYGFFFVKDAKNIHAPKILGLLTVVVSIFIFYYLVWIAIPHARGSQHFALSYYTDFGANPTEVVKNIVFSPYRTISVLFQTDRILYILSLLFPTGFLALIAPVYLVFSFPDIAINLLSNNSQLRQLNFQYTATITPFVYISTIFAIQKLFSKYPLVSKNILFVFLLSSSFLAAYFLGPIAGARYPNLDMILKAQEDKQIIDNLLLRIPRRYSIAATNNLGSHLSRRREIFTIPVGIGKADVVCFLLDDPFAQPSLKAQKVLAQKLKADKNYIMVIEYDDFVVFKKKNVKFRF